MFRMPFELNIFRGHCKLMAWFPPRSFLSLVFSPQECTIGRVCRLLHFMCIIRYFCLCHSHVWFVKLPLCGLKCEKIRYGAKSCDFLKGHPGVFM